ncbi:hypothetical protein ONR07_24765, partial [Salmonella enterica subsp. enterica serovar Anatum]|nr:hypothetical protein [Salmonella enterica subsp. enterica serovar Anatum]
SDVRPSRHLNKAHWSTVYLDGSLPDSQLYYLVDASYQQAVNAQIALGSRIRSTVIRLIDIALALLVGAL